MLNRPFLDTNLKNISDKNKNKFYEEKYLISSPYYNNSDKRLLIVSDIHDQKNVSKEIFKLIYRYAKIYKPDYVIFPGDIFENDSIIDDKKEISFFVSLITSLAQVSKVIIIPGNHDIHNLNIKTLFFKNSKESNKIINFLESLNKIKNVYFLNNEQINLDGINFLSFCPSYKTYELGISKKAVELFMNEYINSSLKMNENEYNILLSHNPLPFVTSDEYKKIDDFNYKTDLIISGHLHGGYIPKFMYNKLKSTNVGLFFYPLAFPYPGLPCRGVYDVGRGKLFISKGYRKWTANIPIFNLFEKFTANDVEELTLTHEEKQKVLIK